MKAPVILSVVHGEMEPVYKEAEESIQLYADRMGFCVRAVGAHPDEPKTKKVEASWWKMLWIEELIRTGHEAVVALDADVAVSKSADNIVDHADGSLSLVVHNSALHGSIPNCGVMVWRGGIESLLLIKRINQLRGRGNTWPSLWEQGALMTLAGMDKLPHHKPIPSPLWHNLPRRFNALPKDWHWKDLDDKGDDKPSIVHFCGERDRKKLVEDMRRYKETEWQTS